MMMMTATAAKMICPNCHVEMNHHCDKLMQASDSQQVTDLESVSGVLEEFHSCPNCGRGGSRHAPS